MVPTELPPGIYQFGQIGRRQVTADFTGGQITSDAGLALVAQRPTLPHN